MDEKNEIIDDENIDNGDIITNEIEDDNIEGQEENVFNDPLLSGPTIDREYSKPNMEGAQFVEFEDIEEPNIKGKSFSDFQRENQEPEITIEENFGKDNQKEEKKDYSNPNLKDADTKTKKKAAEHLADTIIGAYEMLNTTAKDWGKTDMSRLHLKSIKGDFDMRALDVNLPMSESDPIQTIKVIDLLDDINQQLEETFIVTEDFKQRVRPLLIEILKKKGWGMTPEQQLMWIIAEDAAPKVINLFAIKANTKYILDLALKMFQSGQGKNKNDFSDLQSNVGEVKQEKSFVDDIEQEPEKKSPGRPKGSKNRDKKPKENQISALLETEEEISLLEPEEE